MARSNKKIHKDKINALRKKYDDFLEEDKKRKTRNEFILGRLEKMRSCVAAVQSYHNMVEPFVDNNRQMNKRAEHLRSFQPSDDINIQKNIVPSNNSKWMEESIILKEISQKYILIPKTNSSFLKSSYNDENVEIDSDWKAKYNILDRLKKEEKDELPERDIIPSKLIDDKQSDKKPNTKLYEPTQTNNNVTDSSDFNDIAYIANSSYDDNEVRSLVENNQEITIGPITDYYSTLNENVAVDNNITQYQEVSEPKGQLCPDGKSDNTIEGNNYIQNLKEQNAQLNIENINTSDSFYGDTINLDDTTKHNKKAQQESNIITNNQPVTLQNTNVLNKSAELLMSKEGNEEDDNKLPDEHNVKNSDPSNIQPILNSIPGHESAEAPITSELHNTQINEFETEQKEMFYSEESDKPIENSEATVEASEYPAENNYAPYNYYEGTQENQAYPPEINEHEETTENYDPNYEQQYVNSYGNVEYLNQYENQPFENSYANQEDQNINYEYPQQDNEQSHLLPENNSISEQQHNEKQYENMPNTVTDENQIENAIYEQHYQREQQNIVGDEQAQNDEYQPNEHDTQENINRELDAEDGFIEKHETVVVTDTLEENELKISSEHDTIPDVH